MKRFIILIIFISSFFTLSIKANAQDIELTSLTRIEVNGATEFSSSPNGVINLVTIRSSFQYSGQYIKYKMTFINSSVYDYKIYLLKWSIIFSK